MGGCSRPASIKPRSSSPTSAWSAPSALYMRGTDPAHHLHVTHLGPSKFIGLAFFLDNEDDLKKFAKAPGASGIEHLDEPGGGRRVRIDDPHGYQMEVIV